MGLFVTISKWQDEFTRLRDEGLGEAIGDVKDTTWEAAARAGCEILGSGQFGTPFADDLLVRTSDGKLAVIADVHGPFIIEIEEDKI